MIIEFDTSSIQDYSRFIKVKSLPSYKIQGRSAEFPDEYAEMLGVKSSITAHDLQPAPEWMFDYQRDITNLAIRKRKFSLFWDCGLGKTAAILEFARQAVLDLKQRNQGVLIVSPLMVVPQTIEECQKFYGDEIDIEHVRSGDVSNWLLSCGGKVGITNYEAFTHQHDRGRLGALILDESSMLKSHYGKWATNLIEIGKGLDWKLCATGTPAPNDRIEYANHAVFLDHFPTVNSFLATFFVNRGQTDNRWELKPHALEPFYRAISHWCVFLTNPATYGWKDNCETVPPINVHVEDVALTDEQASIFRAETGELFSNNMGGIGARSKFSLLGKGFYKGKRVQTNKTAHIVESIERWQDDESTIVWALYNEEQDALAAAIPNSASISGKTKHSDRLAIVRGFKSGEIRTLISKPKILGFGLNLQVCSRQVFSGLQDSYESYYQAVKRSNRYGSTRALNVHIPVCDVEAPMVQNVLRKAASIERDTQVQERLFKDSIRTESQD
tara:strand:- start:129 stop:1628 length:1500 start_codon:yes stop_codon:yes gene_type:complete